MKYGIFKKCLSDFEMCLILTIPQWLYDSCFFVPLMILFVSLMGQRILKFKFNDEIFKKKIYKYT